MFKPAILVILVAGGSMMLGISIGQAANQPASKSQTKAHRPAVLMGFYSPQMCAEDGGKADGPVSYCTLKDGYVIKFGDFADDDCKTDNGRIVKTAWGKFCGLPSGYSVKIDMSTDHPL